MLVRVAIRLVNLLFNIMFVCLCKSVTDHEIRAAVDGGVHSFEKMQEHLQVSTVCGACTCEVKQILIKRLNKEVSGRRFSSTSSGADIATPSLA